MVAFELFEFIELPHRLKLLKLCIIKFPGDRGMLVKLGGLGVLGV